MPIDSDSLSLLDLGSRCFSKKERKARVHVFVLFSSITLKHIACSIKTLKPPLPRIPFDIVAYVYGLLWDNLSQNRSINPNWLASHQLGFLISFCLIFNICLLISVSSISTVALNTSTLRG